MTKTNIIEEQSVDKDVSRTQSLERTGDNESSGSEELSKEQIDERLRGLGYMD